MVRKLIIIGGADDTLLDPTGKTAIQYAIQHGHHSLASQWESFVTEARGGLERPRRMDQAMANAKTLPEVISLHQIQHISLDSVDEVSIATTTPFVYH